MTAPKWQAGHLYVPGDIVQPITAPAPTSVQVENGSFENGATGWDFTAPVALSTVGGYSGANNCYIPGGAGGEGLALNQTHLGVPPGKSLTASCMIHQGASDVDHTRGWVVIRWYDAADGLIREDTGNVINDGSGGAWLRSSVSAVAPANVSYARAGIALYQNSGDVVNGDYLRVSGAYQTGPSGLVYKAVQPEAGTSGGAEPAWPNVNGVQVIDNEVTWEAIETSRVTWTAHPRYVSGATEPTWPTQVGGMVQDGTNNWRAISSHIEDENCPNSKIVVIAASKVYAADDDIVKYSATVNPLDWTSEQDAGYLPTGLQQYGANPVAGMGLYRSNLVVFNSAAFQMWQVDEDPANAALLDALPIGSTHHKALAPVSNDLFFLADQGVRTVGIAGGSTNLAAGDVGMPIDPLVQEALLDAAINNKTAISTYVPSMGQYWLAFREPAEPVVEIAITGEFDAGTVSLDYSSGLAVTNGTAPYDWSMSALPVGLSMDRRSGVVSGVPTVGGDVTGDVTVTDRYGRTATVSKTIEIVYGSSLAVGYTSSIAIYDGATADYPLAYTISGENVSTDCEIAFSDGGEYMAVSNFNAPYFRLYQRNAEGAYLETATPLDVMPASRVAAVALTSDAGYLFISESTILRVYKRVGTMFQQIYTKAVSGFSYGAKWSPSGEYLAATINSAADGYLAIFRRSGDTITQLSYSDDWDGDSVAWNKAGDRIAFARRNQGIRIIAVDGDTCTQLNTTTGSSPGVCQIRWATDGQHLYLAGSTAVDGAALWVVQWDGAVLTRLADPAEQPPGNVADMDLSSDGRLLAVVGSGYAYLYAADGATLTKIPAAEVVQTAANQALAFLESSDHWLP